MGQPARVAEEHEAGERHGPVAPPALRPRNEALARAGSAAISRMLEQRSSHDADAKTRLLRSVHTQLLHAAMAEYDAWEQVKRQTAEQPIVHGIAAAENTIVGGVRGAGAEAWHAMGGREPKVDAVETRALGDARGWVRLFDTLNALDAAIVAHQDDAAIALARRCTAALRHEHSLTMASTAMHQRGAGAAASQLGGVVTVCVLVESMLSAGTLGAGAGLLEVGGLSALGAGVSRTAFTAVETVAERTQGFEAHRWWDAFAIGGEDAITALVGTVASGALAARFIPKLARFIGSHVGEDVLAKMGKLLDLAGPLPREYFLCPGRILLVSFLSGAGASLLTTPVRVLYERLLAGGTLTLEQFLEQLPGELLRAGLFQALLAGLLHAHAMRRDPSRVPLETKGLEEGDAMKALLDHGGLDASHADLAALVARARLDPTVAPHVANASDAQLMAIIGYTGSDYRIINMVLKMKDARLMNVLRPYTELAGKGLRKMAPYEGWTYRGVRHMPKHELAKYRVGQKVRQDAFTSASTEQGSAFPGGVQMMIRSQTAAEIGVISQYPSESEALFPPGTWLRVIARSDPPNGPVQLTLEEVQGP